MAVRPGGEAVTVFELLRDASSAGIDACTLNNALNVAQLVILVALLRWVRGSSSA